MARLCVVEALVEVCGVTPQLSEPADASPTQFVVWLAILAASAEGTGGRGREQDKLREGVWRRRADITKLLLQLVARDARGGCDGGQYLYPV